MAVQSASEGWELFAKAVGLFGATAGLFIAIDRVSSKQARDDLYNYLTSSNFSEILRNLPRITLGLFTRIFGENHFTIVTFLKSAAVSIGSVIGLLILSDSAHWILNKNQLGTLILWGAWSLVIDYVNLYKTRLIIQALTARHLTIKFALVILLSDGVASFIIFITGFGAILFLASAIGVIFPVNISGNRLYAVLMLLFYSTSGTVIPIYFPTPDYVIFWYFVVPKTVKPLASLSSVLFYAGLMPSIWLWLYIFASLITNAVIRFPGAIRFLNYFLDFKDHPIQSIGVVAAALLTGLYLIFRLLSPFGSI